MRSPVSIGSLAIALLVLGGCGSMRIGAPSLAPRASEAQPVPYPDDVAEPASAADPALVAQVARIAADAEAGHARYTAQRNAAAAILRRAADAPEGSEAWIAAQQAQSALVAARSVVRDAAAAIDHLRVDPAHGDAGDRAVIDAAAARIEILITAEQQTST